MIYVSLTTIPSRINSISHSINSFLDQTVKPDKIFLNIPRKYKRFNSIITDDQIPKLDSIVEITRCEDYGPGTKLLGSLKKIKSKSLVILADDDHIYKNYMIEKFLHYYSLDSNNAYSFYVHPLPEFGIGQGADGFAINSDYLNGVDKFYEIIVKENKELFLQDDLWISFFLKYIKKNKILSLQQHLQTNDQGQKELIYNKHIESNGLILNYGKNLREAVAKRDEIAIENIKYIKEKINNLKF